ncbi:hypothetical protein BFP77_13480 [Maribacter sp. 4U21]|uniref:hypothetical protein n=1 Tax=Maribacter sp. 4U21 TaxID=1889779 RepID=UPI000C15BA33|nr:hypothetical protein [Maribacter sp. 4U21]PIB27043.1 hypothetical protein BFP77_13480 [Maribacter sp. 4U21]
MLIRSSYLILIPLITWITIYCIWNKYEVQEKVSVLLSKILSGIISLALFIYPIIKMNNDTHITNTEYSRTFDGMEAVGDYIEVNGTDWGQILVLLIASTLFFVLGVLRLGSDNSDKLNNNLTFNSMENNVELKKTNKDKYEPRMSRSERLRLVAFRNVQERKKKISENGNDRSTSNKK